MLFCNFQFHNGNISVLLFPPFAIYIYIKNLSKANYSVGWPGNKLEALKHFHYGD